MMHVYPTNDIKEHDLIGTQCDCGVKVITDTPEIIVVHNAYDGRLGVEWANEILNENEEI